MADDPYPVASFSTNLIHLHAPGRIIPIAHNDGVSYRYSSGTSLATAKVAGALALVSASHPGLTADEQIHSLLAAVDKLPAYNGKNATGGRLNYRWAVTGPEQKMTPAGLILHGPMAGTFSVSISHDLASWTMLAPVNADAAGTALAPLPKEKSSYFRTSIP